jgi:hypothetical protein
MGVFRAACQHFSTRPSGFACQHVSTLQPSPSLVGISACCFSLPSLSLVGEWLIRGRSIRLPIAQGGVSGSAFSIRMDAGNS